jgi:hypothetical protein
MSYSSAETIGEDTLTGILGIGFTDSSLVSGALGYRRYERTSRARCPARDPALRSLSRDRCPHLRFRDLASGGLGASAGWRSLGQERLVRALRA